MIDCARVNMDSDRNIRAKNQVITVVQDTADSLDNGDKIGAFTFVLKITSIAGSCGLMKILRW